jgi:hypothetical protein
MPLSRGGDGMSTATKELPQGMNDCLLENEILEGGSFLAGATSTPKHNQIETPRPHRGTGSARHSRATGHALHSPSPKQHRGYGEEPENLDREQGGLDGELTWWRSWDRRRPPPSLRLSLSSDEPARQGLLTWTSRACGRTEEREIDVAGAWASRWAASRLAGIRSLVVY